MKYTIIYDFDGTLTPHPIQKFEILEKCGIKDGAHNPEFWNRTFKNQKENNIDVYTAMYNVFLEIIKEKGLSLTDDNFSYGSNSIIYNNGVESFLDMLSHNNISNYLVSSGLKVFLEKVSISKYFKDIYATTFNYDKNNEAESINFLMSDKNKVPVIKDIMKKIGNSENDCSNIIYIGDGLTDYFAMEYVKNNGGTTIFVCNDLNDKEFLVNKDKMYDVVNLFTTSDYSNNSELCNYIKKICNINMTR